MGNSDHGTTYEGRRGRWGAPTMALHIRGSTSVFTRSSRVSSWQYKGTSLYEKMHPPRTLQSDNV